MTTLRFPQPNVYGWTGPSMFSEYITYYAVCIRCRDAACMQCGDFSLCSCQLLSRLSFADECFLLEKCFSFGFYDISLCSYPFSKSFCWFLSPQSLTWVFLKTAPSSSPLFLWMHHHLHSSVTIFTLIIPETIPLSSRPCHLLDLSKWMPPGYRLLRKKQTYAAHPLLSVPSRLLYDSPDVPSFIQARGQGVALCVVLSLLSSRCNSCASVTNLAANQFLHRPPLISIAQPRPQPALAKMAAPTA